MPDDVSTEVIVFALRIAVVVAIYLFVLVVVRALRAELSAAAAAPAQTAEEIPPDWLEVVDCEGVPDLAGKLYPLEAMTMIGRERGNTVTIPDPRISSRHARLDWDQGRWWVEDLDSANGTFLNGRAVSQPVVAGYGDTLRLGPAVLRLRRARDH